MKRPTSLIAALTVCLPISVCAQISWSGIYDFEILKGGSGSQPGWNQLPNGYLQLNIGSLRLFVDASINESITVSTEISANRQNALDPRFVDLELAYATFWHLAGNGLNISVGKMLTPFGAFTRRQLSPDNPLIGNPLFFYYQSNVSPLVGYLDATSASYVQGSYGGSLSTVYQGGYFVGASVFGDFADDLLEYNIALMNSPLSSPTNALNEDKEPALHGRIVLRPAIWCSLGLSYCYGSFIDRNSTNQFYDASGGIERFKQNAAGLDLTLSYLFYEIDAEYINNRYNAPYVVYTPGNPGWYSSGISDPDGLLLTSDEILVDAKIDIPFFPGLYLAGRYNTLMFGNIIDPTVGSSTYGQSIRWDDDVRKYAVGIGYKPAHGVLIKVNYEKTLIDVTPSPDLDIVGAQLSIRF